VISATVQSGGAQRIGSGGTASNTTLLSGGRQDLSDTFVGGTAISTTMSGGGIQEVHAGGIASETIVKGGGYQQVDAGGSALIRSSPAKA
jgi:autotransporter passenger strand-loop-strand repeat protein